MILIIGVWEVIMREKKEIHILVGNQIRIARERAGFTQEQFGALVSLGPKNVSDIERGLVGISISTLKRICEKLSISSDWILFGDQNMNDVDYLAERLRRMPEAHFAEMEPIFNRLVCLPGALEK